MRIVFFHLLMMIFLSAASLDDYKERVAKAPAGKWVKDLHLDSEKELPIGGVDGDVWYQLADYQYHVEKTETFSRLAYRFLNPEGVGDKSQITITFHPEYQELILHTIAITRDGNRVDHLPVVDINLLHNQKELEQQMYDSSITAHIILKDVQVGDTLEYAYTIRGQNPVYEGHFGTFENLSFGTHVGRVHCRFVWDPKVREMQVKGYSTDKELKPEAEGELMVLVVDEENPPVITYEDNTPDWYYARPYLQLTDFENWDEFGAWAVKRFKIGQELPADLQVEVDKISELSDSKEQVVASLEYAQERYRYLGSFMGEHSHEPYPLAKICSRKFGDCKDKSLLLVHMLRALGLDAHIALVNTYKRQLVKEYLPTYSNFNHAIVHVVVEGKSYWLDPTRVYQRGPLDQLYSSDYKFAYVIDGDKSSLRPMELEGQYPGETIVEDYYLSHGLDKSTTFTSKTIYKGRKARSIRSYFASNSEEGANKDYKAYYAKLHPKVQDGKVTYEDDPKLNILKVRENFEIDEFWTVDSDDEDVMECDVYAGVILSELYYPEITKRAMPYEISHPVNITQTVRLETYEAWNFEDYNYSVENDYVDFKVESNFTEKEIVLKYSFKTKQSYVSPEDLEEYVKDSKKIENLIYYGLTMDTSSASIDARTLLVTRVIGGVFLILGTLAITISCVLIGIFYNPKARPEFKPIARLSGLGGWLILVAIGLYSTVLVSGIGIFAFAENFEKEYLESVLLTENGEYHFFTSLLATLYWIWLFTVFIILTILFHKKRTSFPYLFFISAVVMVVWEIIFYMIVNVGDTWMKEDVVELNGELVRTVTRAAIWGTYMLVSKRVANTFRVRRGKNHENVESSVVSTQEY